MNIMQKCTPLIYKYQIKVKKEIEKTWSFRKPLLVTALLLESSCTFSACAAFSQYHSLQCSAANQLWDQKGRACIPAGMSRAAPHWSDSGVLGAETLVIYFTSALTDQETSVSINSLYFYIRTRHEVPKRNSNRRHHFLSQYNLLPTQTYGKPHSMPLRSSQLPAVPQF